ncbi:MAG: hypothetical protein Q7Q71_06795 [Verrucomicrobiota bacterium JB023]|nr:hypothetical protein [Verrucomicrobiota bacterium JB023]
MTDAQFFQALLVLFYLWECAHLAAPGSRRVGRHIFSGRTLVSSLFLSLGGLRKDLLLKPLLPGSHPGFLLPPLHTPGLSLPRPSLLARSLTLRKKMVAERRFYSVAIALVFFIAIPLVYLSPLRSQVVPLLIAFAYLHMLIVAVIAYRQRRHGHFDPHLPPWAELFFNLLLPWHTMRNADDTLFLATARIHPLCTLLSQPASEARDLEIARLWNKLNASKIDPRLAYYVENAGVNLDLPQEDEAPERYPAETK